MNKGRVNQKQASLIRISFGEAQFYGHEALGAGLTGLQGVCAVAAGRTLTQAQHRYPAVSSDVYI